MPALVPALVPVARTTKTTVAMATTITVVAYVRMNETRRRLLRSARASLAESGLAGTTSRGIAAGAGANLAAITYHFGSKEQLVVETLLDGVRSWLAPAFEVLAGDGDPRSRATEVIGALVAAFEEHRAEAPLVLEALVHSGRITALSDGVRPLLSDTRHLLADQMTAMLAEGSLPGWVEPDAMAGLLVSVAVGLVLQSTAGPDGPALGAMAAQFAALLVAGAGPVNEGSGP